MPHSLRTATVAALAAVLAACTGGSGADTALTTAPTTDSTTSAPTTAASTAPAPTTAPTTSAITPPESMPGDIIEFGPLAGDQLAVVGVAFDDTLNVRIAPGTEFEVVDTLAPDADNVVAGGENRLLTSSFWIEVENGEMFAWANEQFLGFLGVSQTLESDAVSPDGFAAVGRMVAERYASQEPVSRIVQSGSNGNIVVFDVLDIGDDAVKGYRLTVEVEPVAGGDGVATYTEQTICSRGLAPDLKCV